MKILAVTSRIDDLNKHKEIRDCLDQRLISFLYLCGYVSVILPNDIKNTQSILRELTIDGIVLSGGNDLWEYDGKYKIRDENEIALIEHSIKANIPILGICRGMQLIQHFYGVKLLPINNHVGISHKIILNNQEVWVNSYHNWGTDIENKNIRTIAKSDDIFIEAIKHVKYNITGIMWHPERNFIFRQMDINLVKDTFH
ncbi:MAG: Gamma-glutamyl-gamma-aminobutyrate hydrolase PuuD [Candidatus Anoxychlamydiales bacterium]|nr:Gamma-glutamyl-gamma-aminobutyrate hydrolase PuuD [Candidatus Anoxychlamydiales bacterium]NGX35227.1 Gamma-glutamyl-gamma-aminobutyrate hydrolase PuuD [Candidatus Anoxychlamydiales bacterium]